MRRNALIPEEETGGIGVVAADPSLLGTVGATLARGRFIDAANGRYPVVVLGADAAARLGIDRTGVRVWLGGRWFTVIGILDAGHARRRARLRRRSSASTAAEDRLGADRSPSTIYVRAATGRRSPACGTGSA